MSWGAKYLLSQIVTVVGTFVALYSLGNVISYGLGGNDTKAKLWFAIFMFFIILAITAAFMINIYKDKRFKITDPEEVKMQALRSIAKKNTKKPN